MDLGIHRLRSSGVSLGTPVPARPRSALRAPRRAPRRLARSGRLPTRGAPRRPTRSTRVGLCSQHASLTRPRGPPARCSRKPRAPPRAPAAADAAPLRAAPRASAPRGRARSGPGARDAVAGGQPSERPSPWQRRGRVSAGSNGGTRSCGHPLATLQTDSAVERRAGGSCRCACGRGPRACSASRARV